MSNEDVQLALICEVEFGKRWEDASEGERQWCRNYAKEIMAFIEDDSRWPVEADQK